MKLDEPNIQTYSESQNLVRITPDDIRRLVERIVAGVHPEKIYLFGSRAKDNAHDYSDLDLLVVMKTNNRKTRRRSLVSPYTFPRDYPLDIIVYTPEEFEKAANHEDYWFNPLIKDIIKDGVLLFDSATNKSITPMQIR